MSKELFRQPHNIMADRIWALFSGKKDKQPDEDDYSTEANRIDTMKVPKFRQRLQAPNEIDYGAVVPELLPAGFNWVINESTGQHELVAIANPNSTEARVSPQPDDEEHDKEDSQWLEHVIMPEDTLPGICLRYRCKSYLYFT